MSADIKFHNQFIVRTPRLHLTSAKCDLESLLNDQAFMESVYLASPSLYHECEKYKIQRSHGSKELKRMHISLLKYRYRMATRPTPFGLFSGCHVSSFADDANRIIIDEQQVDTHSRLDMEYLCNLITRIIKIPEVRRQLLYFTNNSLYRIGQDWRYVEYSSHLQKRKYQVTEIVYQEILVAFLEACKAGLTFEAIGDYFLNKGIIDHKEEIDAFRDELIDAQVLVTELEPGTTVQDQLSKICEVLGRLNLKAPENLDLRDNLNRIRHVLFKIDQSELARMAGFDEIWKLVKMIGVEVDENRIFHTDMYKKQLSGGLNLSLKTELLQAVTLLNQLTPQHEQVNLKKFREQFYNRYENKEVPLLRVLDTENGIGYLAAGDNQDVTPLIDDMVFASDGTSGQQMLWNEMEQLLHEKMLHKRDNIITFCADDLLNFPLDWKNLPPSLPVVFRMLEGDQIYVESCGGSSAVNLLARFASGNPEIEKMVRNIITQEEVLEPDVIFAEIVHLPETRLGNILSHPPFRNYEIPYIAGVGQPSSTTIGLDDLFVSVRDNRIILRSARLNREIIPRLSNAHNYHKDTLPLYQFLCDLQCQGKRSGMHFNWGSLKKIYTSLPRVTYGNIILSLAQWSFDSVHAKELLLLNGEELKIALQHFRSRWSLPREVLIVEGDHELYIDLEQELLVEVWLERIRKNGSVVLKEFIHSGTAVVNQHGKRYAQQFIAVLQQCSSSYTNLLKETEFVDPLVRRSFSPGSEWLYYKIYCGVRTADKLLLQLIKPVCEELEEAGLIDSWFFIRYNDPDFHLRVRFHATNPQFIGQIIQIFNHWAEPLQENGLIWRTQNDTYNRELERYGSQRIELVERIFGMDSKAVLNMISAVQFEERDNFRWMWAIKSIDELYHAFNLSLEEKFRLTDLYREKFAKEFKVDRKLKAQLDQKYRIHRQRIDRWLMNDGLLLEDPDELCAIRSLFERTKEITSLALQLKVGDQESKTGSSLDLLIGSLVHMAINRVITSKPRMHELIIYDLMARSYQSRIARRFQDENNSKIGEELNRPAL